MTGFNLAWLQGSAMFSMNLFFYGWLTFHCMDMPPFLYPVINWWTFGCICLLVVMSNAAVNIFVQMCIFIFLGYIPGVELLGQMVILFNTLKNHQTFLEWLRAISEYFSKYRRSIFQVLEGRWKRRSVAQCFEWALIQYWGNISLCWIE